MKKSYIALFMALLVTVTAFLSAPSIAYALNFNTETVGPNGNTVPTQQAYTPSERIVVPNNMNNYKPFNNPEDLNYDKVNNDLYIADTLNNRIVYFDLDNEKVCKDFGMNELSNPTGVYVNNSYIYVADKGHKLLQIYNKNDFSFVKSISKPTNALVGEDTPYIPIKVCASDKGDIYIVSEGCSKGLMQINFNGDFVGYIGANNSDKSFLSWIQNLFGMSSDNALLNAGMPPSNVSIDSNGLIYTVTNKSSDKVIKKLNTSGVSILSPNVNKSTTVQVSIDKDDNIYSVESDGSVTIYDSYGNLLFSFTSNKNEEVLGSLAQPVAVCVTDAKDLYILDKEYGLIIKYIPTKFASLVYGAVNYYKDGLYIEGEEAWKEVLKSNSKFILAYKALARASLARNDYDKALIQFKLAEDKEGYSKAYWQIRNNWLQSYVVYIIVPVFAILVAFIVFGIVKKKKPLVFAKVDNFTSRINEKPGVKDFHQMKQFYFHVRDGVYEIKFHNKASWWFALILYLWFICIQILQIFAKGYLFNSENMYNSNALQIILFSTLPLIGIVIANYFVSTVTEGEGKLKDCFITFIYALTPYLIFALPIFIISRVLTYNESVVYYSLISIIYAWCGINIFLTVQELHDYTFWQTAKNILLTIFALLMFVLFIIVIYMLFSNLFGYFGSIFKEMFN